MAPAPAPSTQEFDEYYEEDFPETPSEMPEPELTAQEIVERQTRVAGQMRRHIKRDKHWKDPMHQLPADPEGLPRGHAVFGHSEGAYGIYRLGRRWTPTGGASTAWPRILLLATPGAPI